MLGLKLIHVCKRSPRWFYTYGTVAVYGLWHMASALLLKHAYYRADSRFAPSQWETSLQCNDISLAGCKPRISPAIILRFIWQRNMFSSPTKIIIFQGSQFAVTDKMYKMWVMFTVAWQADLMNNACICNKISLVGHEDLIQEYV